MNDKKGKFEEKFCIEWRIPLSRRKFESRLFGVQNDRWYFLLAISSPVFDVSGDRIDETWTLYLIKGRSQYKCYTENGTPSNFLLTTYVKNRKGNQLFITRKQFPRYDNEVWTTQRSLFSSKHPDGIDLFDNMLTFFFEFDYEKERGDKCVQTSPYLNEHPCLESLSLDLLKLVDEDSNPDVQLKCCDQIHPAHRLILSARSEVFRTMLQSDMIEGREGSIEIRDMDHSVFVIFLQYLYSGTLPELTEDIALPLYEAGDKYRVEALMRRCCDFFAENLSPDNACRILTFADAHNDKDLKERIVTYILDKKLPGDMDRWSKFHEDHSTLATEVLYRAYKQLIKVP